MNDLMSAGLHRLWKDEFVRMAGPVVTQGDNQTTILDVAGGTGDIAFRIVDSIRRSFVRPPIRPKVIVCDINASMLAVGEERSKTLGYAASASRPESPELQWMQGDAMNLHQIPDNSIDLYTIAFGIRNVTKVDQALREAYRVLKPGGRFMCLEFSRVTNPLINSIYDSYSFSVIPAMGQAVANDRASYQYLVESIRKFPDQDTFAGMIEEAGFQRVGYTNFTLGVCAVHSGFKWKAAPAAPQEANPASTDAQSAAAASPTTPVQ